METVNYGGIIYTVKARSVLIGMEYYTVLENPNTGVKLFLYCFPEWWT